MPPSNNAMMKLFDQFNSLPVGVRALAFSLLFTALHFGAVRVIPETKRMPERDPIDWAQKFLLRESRVHTLIAGSSIADRLDPFNTDDDTVMITINGGSAFDGLLMLESIDGQNSAPDIVAIEINRLVVLDPKEWLTDTLNPYYRKAWTELPVLREANRPMSIAAWPVQVSLNKAHITLRDKLRTDSPVSEKNGEPESLDEKRAELLRLNILEQKLVLENPVDDQTLKSIVERLNEHIDRLREAGSLVILFHMPVHPELHFLDGPRSLLTHLKDAFPESEIPWVPEVDPGDYQYSDAIHMTPDSARRYFGFLTNSIRTIAAGEQVRE